MTLGNPGSNRFPRTKQVTGIWSVAEKIKNLTDNQNNVLLLVDGKGMIKIFRSPTNFEGTLLRPSHKVACLTGLGCLAICVQLDVSSAVADCKMNTPTRDELAACLIAKEVGNLPVPDLAPNKNEIFSYEGSNVMMPAPWLRNAVLGADTDSPLALIPIVKQGLRAR